MPMDRSAFLKAVLHSHPETLALPNPNLFSGKTSVIKPRPIDAVCSDLDVSNLRDSAKLSNRAGFLGNRPTALSLLRELELHLKNQRSPSECVKPYAAEAIVKNERLKQLIDHWLWLCPALAILVAALVLVAFGLSLWTGLFVAFLLFCPAVVIWGVVMSRRRR